MIDLTLKNIEFVENNVTKSEALIKFSDIAMNVGCISDKDNFYKGLVEREEEFSTGIGSKVAVPHCKSEAVKKPSVLIQKFTNGVQWEAIDNEDVKLAICLAIPEKEAGTTHIKLLSKIARSLISKEFTKKLLEIDNKEELLNEIKNIISN